MSGDNNNEQSVMIPLDELLAQDPSLGAAQKTNTSAQSSNVDQKRLERVGLGNPNAAAPINSVVVPARRAEIKTKKLSSKLLSVTMIVIGVVALVAVGVYIGTLSNQGAQLNVVKPHAQPTAQVSNTPKNPKPAQAVAVAPSAQADEPAEEAKKPKPAKVSPKSRADRTRSRARRKSKRKTQASAPKPPAPPPPPAAPAKPKASEATSLLRNIGKGPKPSSQKSSATAPESDLPTRLGRSQILGTLRKNQASVSKCKSHVSAPTRLKVRVVVAGSGSVSKVSLVEPANLKGSPVEQCVLKRVKLFKFPKFGSPSMSFKLPFRLG